MNEIELFKQIARDTKRRRREMARDRRKIQKSLKTIALELKVIYPDPVLVEAVSLLTDQDLVWHGDFDTLREPIAELMFKVHQTGLFKDEVNRLASIVMSYELPPTL